MSDKHRQRSDYPWFLDMPTRWGDNDQYGHMNNAVYYRYYENVVMHWLEIVHGFNLHSENVRCFTVQNGCEYHESVKHPALLQCGLRISKIGNSSVRYELGIFNQNSDTPSASGFIVEVFVDAQTERPIRVPDEFRKAMEPLLM